MAFHSDPRGRPRRHIVPSVRLFLLADFPPPRSARISDFITTNGIREEVHTALTPMRGRLYQQHRPDSVLRYDLENAITAESPAITEKIIRLLDEAKGGVAAHGASLAVGTFIIETDVIGYIRQSVERRGGRVRFIPMVDRQGVVAWPAKFVKTDAEALEANRDIHDSARRKISLGAKRRELNAGGRRVYEVEMLLDAMAAGSTFFDRGVVERLMTDCREAKESKAGFELWGEFNPAHR